MKNGIYNSDKHKKVSQWIEGMGQERSTRSDVEKIQNAFSERTKAIATHGRPHN